MDEILIVIGFFTAPVVIVFLVLRYKLKKLQVLHDIAKGDAQLTPQLLQILRNVAYRHPSSDYRLGILCCAAGLALATILGLETFENSPRLMLVSALPIFIGIGYIVAGKIAGPVVDGDVKKR